MEYLILICALLSALLSLATLIFVAAKCQNRGERSAEEVKKALEKQSGRFEASLSATRQEINAQTQNSVNAFSQTLTSQQALVFEQQGKRIEELSSSLSASVESFRKTFDSSLKAMDSRMNEITSFQEKNAQALRTTVTQSLSEIRQGNEKSLGEIRQSVDEKLQKTLEDRISRSFKEVSDRLSEVYQGLGEMKNLASGVGDLKKVLSNVKTRGILGEIQLGAILEEILSPEQYETNVATVPRSQNRVEFAIRLPGGEEGSCVYLPIDSKFPSDAYIALQDAYDAGDTDKIRVQRGILESRIKSFAKDIHDKYVSVPYTTDFAILFLPTEGLYAEVVKMGLVEVLQRNYKINIAGPTTMAALLNSLQTGFRTLAIQKRSSEVWQILGAVRTEFDKFEGALRDAQNKIDQANRGLDTLVGVRTRQIQRKLKNVALLPADEAKEIITAGGETDDGEE